MPNVAGVGAVRQPAKHRQTYRSRGETGGTKEKDRGLQCLLWQEVHGQIVKARWIW